MPWGEEFKPPDPPFDQFVRDHTLRMLNVEEAAILLMLGSAMTSFTALDAAHPHDLDEFMRAIHAAQNIVLARPATEYQQRRRQHGNQAEGHEAAQAAAGRAPDPTDEAANAARND